MRPLLLIAVVAPALWALGVLPGWTANPSHPLYPRLDRPALTSKPASAPPAAKPEVDPKQKAEAFHKGYRLYSDERYQEACVELFRYLSEQTPDDTDYEWAEFFFGLSLHRLGLTHASVDTLTNVMTRKPNPKIVDYAMELLEDISRTVPFDRDLLIHRGVCDQSYGFVDSAATDFVHYYQGEYDWEHGLFAWGDAHFGQIRPDTYYYHKYLFKKALRVLYDGRTDEAVSLLKKVILQSPNGTALKDDARKTLARIYYETGEFAKADFLYQQIEMNIVEQAQNLLERAWAHYRMGNSERAMGLLYSFEAPSYVNSFTPEFYILKSFIYKDVCHYKKAMQVLEQFRGRYGPSLQSIYQRRPPQENRAMLMVILNKPKTKRDWQFVNQLDKEMAIAAQNPDPALKVYLERLYSLKKEEMENQFRILVRDEYEKMANEMLRFEEEAHLMEYELGLDMYQRVYNYHYAEEKKEEKPEAEVTQKAVFSFQGEFWNDELDDYEVTLPNKCENAEEWDIFFK
jgi:tetratricopeptide (TPR) repeat protein